MRFAHVAVLTNLEIATADLLCEGKYAELMQAKPKTGSTMVSYVWGCFQLGSLFAAFFVGPMSGEHGNPFMCACLHTRMPAYTHACTHTHKRT
jgi:hypothetical protein